jgi:nicotinate-nucleotide pyrophosphorylase (carboxylating)
VTEHDITRDFDLNALRERTRHLARLARDEDLGRGDITSALVADEGAGRFRVLFKQQGVFAGREIARTVLDVYDTDMTLHWLDAGGDGKLIDDPPVPIAEIAGPVATVLSAERVLLNFLQRLCGVATHTRSYVDAVAGARAVILDTRKTTPGWRLLEKYAVRCGGGRNHRMGLYDAILIKDNHLAPYRADQTAGALFAMLNKAAALEPPPKFVEVEADTLEQVEQIFSVVGVDVVLLDNFSLKDLRAAVELRDGLNLRGKVRLEASGGVTLETVGEVARTGVDYISVGAITHSATAVDLSLERIA